MSLRAPTAATEEELAIRSAIVAKIPTEHRRLMALLDSEHITPEEERHVKAELRDLHQTAGALGVRLGAV